MPTAERVAAKERPGRGAEQIASVCLTDQGDCLRDLGRLDEAAATYEKSIRRSEALSDVRQVAVGKVQLGTVRLQQRRHAEALAAYADARERFTRLDEPGSVAVIWHQTGVAYQGAGELEAAEDAYRKSLAVEVRLGNVTGQARTLAQLGTLYSSALGRTEEGVTFLRQAVDKYVEVRDAAYEGKSRSSLASQLHKLRRLDEARQEIRRAIECSAPFGHASEPWRTWATLADIEVDAGDPAAAAEAKGNAMECYLAYRRDGGENHSLDGRLGLEVTESLLAGDAATATSLLQQALPHFEAAGFGVFIHALQAIVAGRRDRALADAPELPYSMAGEILFLIETLEKT